MRRNWVNYASGLKTDVIIVLIYSEFLWTKRNCWQRVWRLIFLLRMRIFAQSNFISHNRVITHILEYIFPKCFGSLFKRDVQKCSFDQTTAFAVVLNDRDSYKELKTITYLLFGNVLGRDVTKFEFEFECCRTSHNFTAFDICRMFKLPSRRMRIW